jgi:polyhydroxybutyrate depolymerase
MISSQKIFRAVLVTISLLVALVLSTVAFFYALISSYAPNSISGTIVSSGQKREYLLHVSSSYDRAKPTPLVISLHGAGSWPATQREASQWNRAADEQGFIVVYPAGTTLDGSGTGVLPFRVWLTEPGPTVTADSRFISDLIDSLSATYNIDPARIYANGLSNGGDMAFALSCTLSHRIAAIGMVAAAHALTWSWCTDPHPVPLIAFHGTADPLVPYNGAETSWLNPRPFPNIPGFVAHWGRRNRCVGRPTESEVAPDVSRREYTGCAADASVVLYTIRGGGHQWPGGKPFPIWIAGPTSRRIDATSLMWAFYRQHPLLRN